MREITLTERNNVSGGNNAIAGLAVGALALYFLLKPSNQSAKTCETLFRQVITYDTEIYPLYDEYRLAILCKWEAIEKNGCDMTLSPQSMMDI